MATDITIAIPWTPQPQVSPNTRNSSRNKQAHHRANAATATLATRSHMAREPEPFACPDQPAMDVTVYLGRNRKHWDLDNLAAGCKGVVDGVTRELGFDDRRLVAISYVQTRDPDGLGFTTIRIRPATVEERRRVAA